MRHWLIPSRDIDDQKPWDLIQTQWNFVYNLKFFVFSWDKKTALFSLKIIYYKSFILNYFNMAMPLKQLWQQVTKSLGLAGHTKPKIVVSEVFFFLVTISMQKI